LLFRIAVEADFEETGLVAFEETGLVAFEETGMVE
jgi:hypothetical protein